MRDPYKILGVKRDAGQDEIKAAWRNMAKAVHPDHNQGDPTAGARFAEIGRAYETLKDPKKRSLFDTALRMAEAKQNENTIMQQRQVAREAAMRARAAQANAERVMEELARAAAQKAAADAAARPQPAQQQQTQQQQTGTAEPAEEMIERIFGAQARTASAGGGRAQSFSASATRRPETEASNAEVQTDAAGAAEGEPTVEEAAAAASAILQPLSLLTSLVRRFTGSAPLPEKAPDQIATATVTIDDILKGSWTSVDLGEGREAGFALTSGTTEGHQVRLKGQGHKLAGMQRGDAVINIHIAADARFTVDGFDLHAVLPVTIENAVLGAEAHIDGPNGSLTVTVPAWSGSDKTIRIPGQGLANGEGGKGDLVVELRIILWEKPDAKVTDLMRSMKNGLFL